MTIVDPVTSGEDAYVEENTPKEGQKYLALHVPNFSGNLHSYLVLGADTEWAADNAGTITSVYGNTLAGLVRGFCDDDRPRAPAAGTTIVGPAVTAPAESVDDTGSKTLTPVPNGESESGQLHWKGGWRDHSDGNRITTTFGDKLEVIRGNYKLLVLGRQDDPTKQVAGWDVSGGLVSTDANSLNYPSADKNDPAAVDYGGQSLLSTQYDWEQDSDGNWGWTMTTVTGSPTPTTTEGNGRAITYTWVDEKFTYLGSGSPTLGTGSQDPDLGVEDNVLPAKILVDKQWGESILHAVHATPAAAGSGATAQLNTLMTSDGVMSQTTTVKGNSTVQVTADTQTVTNQFGNDNLMGYSLAEVFSQAAAGAAIAGAGSQMAEGVGELFVSGAGKLGPTIAGMVEGATGAPSTALEVDTTVKGPCSIKNTVYGTNSTSNYTIGSIATTNLSLGMESKTSVNLMGSEIQLSGIGATIKLRGMASDFDIALSSKHVYFAPATATTIDLSERIINQAPSLMLNYLSMTLAGVNHFETKVIETKALTQRSVMSLLHLLL